MKKYDFFQVDAFTNVPLKGNPCAIIFGADDLSDEKMLSVAKEMNLSETSFVSDSKVADFEVRYFTPAEEIPMAGHPTIATVYALIKNKLIQLDDEIKNVTLEMQVGIIKVEIKSEKGIIESITMFQKRPIFMQDYSPAIICPVFGIKETDLIANVPIRTVSTGTPQLMIALNNREALKNARLDFQAYEQLRNESDFFSPHLFILNGFDEGGDTFARHFGLPPDTPEDPFTGSATGGMAAFIWRYGLISNPHFTAQQGHWMGRPGKAFVEVVGSRDEIDYVKVGGQAVQIISGILELN